MANEDKKAVTETMMVRMIRNDAREKIKERTINQIKNVLKENGLTVAEAEDVLGVLKYDMEFQARRIPVADLSGD